MAPVAINAAGHPYLSVIHGTRSGVIIAPRFVPELKMPVAKALSLFGNHSATALIDAGKLRDSPNASPNRAATKPKTLRTRAWAMAGRVHRSTDSESPRRVPNRSSPGPTAH